MGCLLPVGRNGCVGCVGCLIPLLLTALLLLLPLTLLRSHRHPHHAGDAQSVSVAARFLPSLVNQSRNR